MKQQTSFDFGFFVFLMLFVAGAGGWIANIVLLIAAPFDPVTGMEIARVVGVFVAPLGVVLGYL